MRIFLRSTYYFIPGTPITLNIATQRRITDYRLDIFKNVNPCFALGAPATAIINMVLPSVETKKSLPNSRSEFALKKNIFAGRLVGTSDRCYDCSFNVDVSN